MQDKYAEIARLSSRLFKTVQIENELTRLLRYVDEIRPKVILELGTSRGGTLFAFSQFAASDALLISVDLPNVLDNKDGEAICDSDKRAAEKAKRDLELLSRTLLKYQPKQASYFIRKNSHDPDVLTEVQDILHERQVDLLFLDGDHSYEGVKQDFETYYPLVAPRGMIAFHDIYKADPSMNHNVEQFWEEIRRSFPCDVIIDSPKQSWAGIGVLYNDG